MLRTKLTVYFEDPYWVGIFEKFIDSDYSVCRFVFGSEPTDTEVFLFILGHSEKLVYSRPKPGDAPAKDIEAVNPKRLQRMAAKEMQSQHGLKKAYEAIRQELELKKTERKTISKAERDEMKQRKYDLKQEKRKEKHKGH